MTNYLKVYPKLFKLINAFITPLDCSANILFSIDFPVVQ